MFTIHYEKDNCEGSVLIIALLVLALLSIIGMISTNITVNEFRASSNIINHKMAFYAAESARNYVAQNPTLYGPDNMDSDNPVSFQSPEEILGLNQSFEGTVQYLDRTLPPRGSGYDATMFKAYRYKVLCKGYGPSHAMVRIETGFYRIGY